MMIIYKKQPIIRPDYILIVIWFFRAKILSRNSSFFLHLTHYLSRVKRKENSADHLQMVKIMNKKEILELRKTFRPEECNISRIATCYVTSEKEKILEKSQAFLSLPEEEAFKYFDILKQALSGTVGKNLYTLKTNSIHLADESPQKLETLRKYHMNDEGMLTDLFDSIIGSYDSSENYLIIVVNGLYDIPGVTSDDQELEDASDEVYSYILTCICPVELDEPGLSIDCTKPAILDKERDWMVKNPVNALLYPAFTDRATDIHHALYFAKKAENSQDDFLKELIGSEMMLSDKEEHEWFLDTLNHAHEEQMPLETAKEIHTKLVEKSLEKENLPSAGMLSKKELLQVIDKELNADQVKDIDEDYDKTVGKENDITIKNLVNPKKMVIQTGTAKVEIDSDYADMVETKRIDGRLYLAVPLTSNDILVDGCAVRTEALSD